MTPTIQDAAVRAAVRVAARHGITAAEPAVLADGANIVVHLRPAPVVAKVAASTPAVRRDNQDWLRRELDVSAFLSADGAPVVPPSPELPATTHHDHGHVMSFWRYPPPADPTDPKRPDEETIGSMLRDLHAALRRYPKTPPTLAPLQDIPAFLARPQTHASSERKAALAAALRRYTAELDPAAEQQVLHGDAGAGNLMATDRGWVWHDFEDTCSGPVAWDLAASTASRYQDGPRVLAAYRDPVDPGQLAVCEQLRLAAPDRLVQLVRRAPAGARPARRRAAGQLARRLKPAAGSVRSPDGRRQAAEPAGLRISYPLTEPSRITGRVH